MNRKEIISSALKTVSNNPFNFAEFGFDAIYDFLQEYNDGRLSLADLELMSSRTLNKSREWEYGFQISPQESSQLEESILHLHRRYFSVPEKLVGEIKSGIGRVLSITVFESSQAAMSVVNGKNLLNRDRKKSTLEVNMWKSTLGQSYLFDENFTSLTSEERVRCISYKLRDVISARLEWREERRYRASQHMNV